ncbi:FkbM family methyltransferase [Silvanigrella paludirubra]|uniref:FkbM family methyltransferase n=1 Tax=Silvanigrella paludirubra TaxID=2499159 RepID=A0A6N6VUN7_9BACT|nr:FkbM family methyltransferase [Silvanigrella paludirubra]KAB8036811.1 FkbM family methyltransferase [Silvanigrella paludirubra]
MKLLGRIKKSIKHIIFDIFNNLFKKASSFKVALHERMFLIYEISLGDNLNLKLYCPNMICMWRANTFYSKEPETLNWISSIKKGEIFYDVGANIGLYSLYAAKMGVKVFSFEPVASNYWLLNKNTFLNSIKSENMKCYNLALSSEDTFGFIDLSSNEEGSAMHSIDLNVSNNSFRQGVYLSKLDTLINVYGFPVPNYLKIDVDGVENKIITGAESLLSNKNLKSILIELDASIEVDLELKNKILSYGFKLKPSYPGQHVGIVMNYIFTREE